MRGVVGPIFYFYDWQRFLRAFWGLKGEGACERVFINRFSCLEYFRKKGGANEFEIFVSTVKLFFLVLNVIELAFSFNIDKCNGVVLNKNK